MPETALIVLVLVVVGVVLLAALAVGSRRRPADAASMNRPEAATGMSIGMVLGALLGTVVWISTGEFVFWVIFMGGGMTVGLAAGTAYGTRSR
jgi:UDP-N-acetylmuramyl pentapeptide phosphotransferase/UDP-N-acetylglucosamine-1-phosphate transferase